jgi:hypothetical protein
MELDEEKRAASVHAQAKTPPKTPAKGGKVPPRLPAKKMGSPSAMVTHLLSFAFLFF